METGHQRFDVDRVDPKARQAVVATQAYVRAGGLDPRPYELVNIRASQLTGVPSVQACTTATPAKPVRTSDVSMAGARGGKPPSCSLMSSGPRSPCPRRSPASATPASPVQVWNDVTGYFDEPGIVDPFQSPATISVWNRLAITIRRRLADVAVAT